jgi:predicted nucleic acid-binding protein
MAGITLDAGGLIAIERADRRLLTTLKFAHERGDQVTIPAPVLSQVWRGARSARLAAFLKKATVEILDENLAKEAGELCGRAGTSDIVDAVVAVSAARRNDDIVTSDPHDLRRLKQHVPGTGVVFPI